MDYPLLFVQDSSAQLKAPQIQCIETDLLHRKKVETTMPIFFFLQDNLWV